MYLSVCVWLTLRRRDACAPMSMSDHSDAITSRLIKQKTHREAWAPVPDWRSRGYLPHCDEIGLIQNITFRLADSVPAETIAAWRDELEITSGLSAYDPRIIEFRRRMDRYEDAGYGDCWLRYPLIAELVRSALLFFDGDRYRLLEWCVMPNHVHVLVLPVNGHALASIVHSWKSWTGHASKKLTHSAKSFWMIEYHDRFIRDERHLKTAREYIRLNPVAAGLVPNAEEWLWSSASE